MKKLFICFGWLMLTGIVAPSLAQEASPKPWTPAEVVATERATSFAFSPDSRMVVWAKRSALTDKDKFVSHLYLTRLDLQKDGKYRTFQLTHGEDSDSNPVFSADGETIYFLSSRKEGKKLWAMSLYGGEPQEMHNFPNGISGVCRLNDSLLIFLSNDGKTWHERQLEEKKDQTEVIEDSVHRTISHLYSFHPETKEIRRITANRYPVSQYATSRDGRMIVYSVIPSTHYEIDNVVPPRHYLLNRLTGQETEILQGLLAPASFQFSADGQGFYFTAGKTSVSGPYVQGSISELYYYDLGSGAVRQVNLQWPNGLGSGYLVAGNDVLVSLADGARLQYAFYQRGTAGWSRTPLNMGFSSGTAYLLATNQQGSQWIINHSSTSELPRYLLAQASADRKTGYRWSTPRELFTINEPLRKRQKPKGEVISWKGYKQEDVTGILYYPAGYEAGKKYPLVISIHGGPNAADLDEWNESWAYMPAMYTQRGAFVLLPNYHGSGNHGLAYAESILKNYYDPELEDIISGINYLEGKGWIDRSQMAVTGWSNGAILSTMLTVRYPDMFKAAAPGAGDVNWTSDYGTCEFGVVFDQAYFGGAPWDDVDGKIYNETYILKSPLFEMEKVKTPTIIFHGSEDRAVPRDQGWEYYRALQQVGKAPVRFLWFPGQLHGLSKPSFQLRKMTEELAWLDRYLFGTYQSTNEAFKADSPLAHRLVRDSTATTPEGLLGVLHTTAGGGQVLIPETAMLKTDSLALGRYEVTNAQFAAFQPAHRFLAEQANYPVTVSAEQAKAYAEWLSAQTGHTYRLPTEAEAGRLHKEAMKAAAKENTLAHWAGYALTPTDAGRLREKIAALRSTLIMRAGTFPPVRIGQSWFYDLGGNVAEWSASGVCYGFSAYDFADPAGSQVCRSEAAHTGFRVVKEAAKK